MFEPSDLPRWLLRASWYVQFNAAEGVLWMLIAAFVATNVPCSTPQQRWSTRLGAAAFVLFGLTDWLECRYEGLIPLWLWAAKIGCGAVLLIARYGWKGWRTFRWNDREVVFAAGCLVAVLAIIFSVQLARLGAAY